MDQHIQERHAPHNCQNCGKRRNGEELDSIFDRNIHYVTWECEKCGAESWWKTKKMVSHIKHTTIDKKVGRELLRF